MASFAYQTPAENFFSRLDGSRQEDISVFQFEQLRNTEETLGNYFNYHLSDKAKETLTKEGLYLSPHSFVVHSHPACKTIENYFLYVVLPSLVSNRGLVNFLGIKAHKIYNYKKFDDVDFRIINRIVTSRDHSRYCNVDPSRLHVNKRATVFIHDELHYWDVNQLVSFLRLHKPRKLLATLVYPPELLIGLKASARPELYEFDVEGDRFHFYPDGIKSEKYTQSLESGYLLRSNCVWVDGQRYCVTLLKTLGAHHLISIDPDNNCLLETERHFGNFEVFCVSDLFPGCTRRPVTFLNFRLFKKILIYLCSLKKPDVQSALAKLRQMENEEISIENIFLIKSLAEKIITKGLCDYESGVCTVMRDWLIDICPFKTKLEKINVINDFRRRLIELQPLEIKVNLVEAKEFIIRNFFLSIKRKVKNDDPNDPIINIIKRSANKSLCARRIKADMKSYHYGVLQTVFNPRSLSDTLSEAKCKSVYMPVFLSAQRKIYNDLGRTEYNGLCIEYPGCKSPAKAMFDEFCSRERSFEQLRLDWFHIVRSIDNCQPQCSLTKRVTDREWKIFEIQKIIDEGDREEDKAKSNENGEPADDGNSGLNGRPVVNDSESNGHNSGPSKSPTSNTDSADHGEANSKNQEHPKDGEFTDCDSDLEEVFEEEKNEFVSEGCPHQVKLIRGPFDEFKVESLRLKEMKVTKLKGRKAYFFSDGLTYFHDHVSYQTNELNESLRGLIKWMDDNFGYKFNSVLVQEYECGARVPAHKDDESVYGDDPIVTVNLNGRSKFYISCCNDNIELKHGDMLVMPEKFQRKYVHAVKSLDEGRISLTFRLQIREPDICEKIEFIKTNKIGCFFKAIAEGLFVKEDWVMKSLPIIIDECVQNRSVNMESLSDVSRIFDTTIELQGSFGTRVFGQGAPRIIMELKKGHYKLIKTNSPKTASRAAEEMKVDQKEPISSKFIEKLNSVEVNLNHFDHVVDQQRLAALLKSLMSGNSGVVSSARVHEGWRMIPGIEGEDSMKAFINSLKGGRSSNDEILEKTNRLLFEKFDLYGVFGFAGSGKSHCLMKLLESDYRNDGRVMVVTPRKFLNEAWAENVGKFNVKTFESFLKANIKEKEVIVIDELGLYPKGYIDLVIAKRYFSNPDLPFKLVVLGDPLQACYFNQKDDYALKGPEEFRLVPDGVKYKNWSYRIPKSVADKFKIQCFNDNVVSPYNMMVFDDAQSARAKNRDAGYEPEVLLVPSFVEKTLFSEFGNVMTFGEAQGLSFKFGLICLSEETKLVSDRHMMVALTRFRNGFSFFVSARGSKADYLKSLKSSLLSRFLDKNVDLSRFIAEMSPIKIEKVDRDMSNSGAGLDEVDREAKMAGDPWLKSMIYLGQRGKFVDSQITEVNVLENPGKTHIPIETEEFLAVELDKIIAREKREFKSRGEWSTQFKEERDERFNFRKGEAQCMNYEAIYPRHLASDDLTFWAAVKKRLVFSNPEKERVKFKQSYSKGKIIFDEFLRHVPLPRMRNGRLLEESRAEFEEVKMKKNAATIENHCERSNPDWPTNIVRIFMKSQLCTKYEKRFSEAKAGQTLACFSHSILVHFSPWCRYIEKVMNLALPKNFYIHQKRNFSDLEEFSRRYCRGGLCVESDYTAFDSSQDHTILAFEVELMNHIGIDKRIIMEYIELKCTLGSKLGNFAIMRFTGEFSTFLFNTLCNMAFTFMSYDVPRGSPICFAGDDMCALRHLNVRHNFKHILEKLKLKAKVQITENPMFCGWRLNRYGLVKEPCLVYERLQIAREKDRLHEVIESYFIEFSYAYKLGDRLLYILNENQLSYHQWLCKFFVKNKNLLKGESRKLLEELEYLSEDDIIETAQRKDSDRGYTYRECEHFAHLL